LVIAKKLAPWNVVKTFEEADSSEKSNLIQKADSFFLYKNQTIQLTNYLKKI